MNSLKRSIETMHKLLDELIKTAKNLKKISEQVIPEEELTPLQEYQDDLLGQITSLDRELKEFANDITEEIHQQFHKKLEEFQSLNKDFINNLNQSHGLIQFDLHKFNHHKIEKKS